jgi:hypothetical protein
MRGFWMSLALSIAADAFAAFGSAAAWECGGEYRPVSYRA